MRRNNPSISIGSLILSLSAFSTYIHDVSMPRIIKSHTSEPVDGQDMHWCMAWVANLHHYGDVIMGSIASQITSPTNRFVRRRSKKTSKLRVTGLCVGNSPETVEFPAQGANNAENVSIWWRHWVYNTGPLYINQVTMTHLKIGCPWITSMGAWSSICLYTLRPRQNCRYFADDIFKCTFFNEKFRILNKISLKHVP